MIMTSTASSSCPGNATFQRKRGTVFDVHTYTVQRTSLCDFSFGNENLWMLGFASCWCTHIEWISATVGASFGSGRTTRSPKRWYGALFCNNPFALSSLRYVFPLISWIMQFGWYLKNSDKWLPSDVGAFLDHIYLHVDPCPQRLLFKTQPLSSEVLRVYISIFVKIVHFVNDFILIAIKGILGCDFFGWIIFHAYRIDLLRTHTEPGARNGPRLEIARGNLH